jgi:hypothetical protein
MSPADDTEMAREAARQQALVAALWNTDRGAAVALERWCRDSPVTVARGLQAYRGNAAANAARALGAAYPTVCALVGTGDFQQLARELWFEQPPERGDLAQWGEPLAARLQTHPALGDWPYLADCARLDWAVLQCERATDAELDAPSIARLGDTDPARLRIELRPGLAVVVSPWPIVTIHQAHREGAGAEALHSARAALQEGVAESALVSRSGWRAQVHRIDRATTTWTQRLLVGDSLASAIDAVSEDVAAGRFDLAAWLSAALTSGWLKGITVADD